MEDKSFNIEIAIESPKLDDLINCSPKCNNGNHNWKSVNDGTLDVKCTRCGIKAMRAVAYFNK